MCLRGLCACARVGLCVCVHQGYQLLLAAPVEAQTTSSPNCAAPPLALFCWACACAGCGLARVSCACVRSPGQVVAPCRTRRGTISLVPQLRCAATCCAVRCACGLARTCVLCVSTGRSSRCLPHPLRHNHPHPLTVLRRRLPAACVRVCACVCPVGRSLLAAPVEAQTASSPNRAAPPPAA